MRNADPAILHRPSAQPRHALLVQLVVEERFVVGDDDQHRHAIVNAGPERGDAHQVVAVAEHRDRQPIAAAQRQRRADRHARTRADAAAAVEADVVERMREAAELARPAERQPDVRGPMRSERVRRDAREIVERQSVRSQRVASRSPAARLPAPARRTTVALPSAARGPSAASNAATSASGGARIARSVGGSA